MADTKRCTKCGETKPVTEFYKSSTSKDRLQYHCRTCQAKRRHEWKVANPEKARAAGRKHSQTRGRERRIEAYGITADEYAAQLAKQGGRCAICQRKPTRTPHIDHDHACCPGVGNRSYGRSCGKCVRGILCASCNHKLLGLICQETSKGTAHAIEVLERAIAYLRHELPEQQGFGNGSDVDRAA